MSEVRSLARGLLILGKLAEYPDGVSVTEIAEEFDVDKSSASRMLQTLANYGFSEKDRVTQRYVLGPQIVRLSRLALTRMPLRETAKPFLNQLAKGKALYIDQEDSPNPLSVSSGVGTLSPLHCTALGKVLLAYCNAPIGDNLETYTVRTITDPISLQHHLETVCNQGYAVDDEEHHPGVRCIAVPVYDFRDRCVAAIGVSGPTSRLTLEELPRTVETVIQIVDGLNKRLGFKDES
jgi:DNA-binding IclR family transcriptional regulator